MAKKKTEVIKFTEDELKSLDAIKNDYINIQNEFGRTKVRKLLALKQVDEIDQYEVQLESAYLQVQETEQKLAQTLEEKYGKGNLNVETVILRISSIVLWLFNIKKSSKGLPVSPFFL